MTTLPQGRNLSESRRRESDGLPFTSMQAMPLIPEIEGENRISSWRSNDEKTDGGTSDRVRLQRVPPNNPAKESNHNENIQEKLRSTMLFFGEKNLASKFNTESSVMTTGSTTTGEGPIRVSPNQNHFRVKTYRESSAGGYFSHLNTPGSNKNVSERGQTMPFKIKTGRLATNR